MKKLPDGIKMPDPQKSELKYDEQQGELFWFDHMTLKQRDEFLKLSPDKLFQKAIKQFHRRSQPRQMTSKWVFAGSAFVTDATGTKHYRAEGGTLICLANFPSAMIDVAFRSSAQAGHSLYEAHTERIPPKGTEVTIELIPVVKKAKKTKRDGSKSKDSRRP